MPQVVTVRASYFWVKERMNTLIRLQVRTEPKERAMPKICPPPVSPPTMHTAPRTALAMQTTFLAVMRSCSSNTAKKQMTMGFMQLMREARDAPASLVPYCCRPTDST